MSHKASIYIGLAAVLTAAAMALLLTWHKQPVAVQSARSSTSSPPSPPSERIREAFAILNNPGTKYRDDSFDDDIWGSPRAGKSAMHNPSGKSASAQSGRIDLLGKPLRYLIGAASAGPGADDAITVVPYDANNPVKYGISVGYCNLFDETNSGRYGPYLRPSDTAAQYHEGHIDPRGEGWTRNLREQFERRRSQGFEYVELDNADSYAIKDVIGAIELAGKYGLKVIAKNPGLQSDPAIYVEHPNVYGIIVEQGAGKPADMDELRRKARKPDIPVWFVAFGSKGRSWAEGIAAAAKNYVGMGVTHSSLGEYGNAIDVLSPMASLP